MLFKEFRTLGGDNVGFHTRPGNARRCNFFLLPLVLVLTLLAVALSAQGDETFNWNKKQNRVSADLHSLQLRPLLEQVASATGWQVYLEPDTTHNVSAKFKDLPPGEALRLLLGDLNFALVPEGNAKSRLYVFRTIQRNATHLIVPQKKDAHGKIIPNELLVTLKPGAKIDELAKLLGAKVTGRISGLNAYRLEFENQEAANAAREQLATNSDVASVDNNYSVERPSLPTESNIAGGGPPHLQLNPPPANGRVVVGLVDTAIQSLGVDLDKFMLNPISVAGDAQPGNDSPTHGTSMAETILRSLEMTTKGSTSVQILPVDVYGANESTTTWTIAEGIKKAVDGGATILNLSFGSEGDSPFLRDLLKDAVQKNIGVFAAAGNQPVTTPFYPAAYSDIGIIAVTATDHGQIADYANRGSFVTAAAPGTSLIYFNGQQWYAVGTSSATAVASGMAAGYMDSTRSDVNKMKSFIQTTLGVKQGKAP
jgi:hypothetical protein